MLNGGDNLFDSSQLIIEAVAQGIVPLIRMLLIPLMLWVVLPGLIATKLFRSNEAYFLGAFIGFLGMITVGPFST